jgi:hypothetical protein
MTEERIMSASISRPAVQQQFGRLWWLPPGGLGNGIDDHAWAPILEVAGDLVAPLLTALRAAGVPAHAGAVRPGAVPARHKLWVGTSAYGRAEETLIAALPALTGGRSDSRP